MTTLFISDLHLDAERPAVTELFGAFMQKEATRADALYILGDLFEAWVGDDDPSEAGRAVADGVRAVVDAGVPVAFMQSPMYASNRSNRFSRASIFASMSFTMALAAAIVLASSLA